MAKIQETPDMVNGETESILDEYRSRISQALEKEKRKLIGQAEQESQDILTRGTVQMNVCINESHGFSFFTP